MYKSLSYLTSVHMSGTIVITTFTLSYFNSQSIEIRLYFIRNRDTRAFHNQSQVSSVCSLAVPSMSISCCEETSSIIRSSLLALVLHPEGLLFRFWIYRFIWFGLRIVCYICEVGKHLHSHNFHRYSVRF